MSSTVVLNLWLSIASLYHTTKQPPSAIWALGFIISYGVVYAPLAIRSSMCPQPRPTVHMWYHKRRPNALGVSSGHVVEYGGEKIMRLPYYNK